MQTEKQKAQLIKWAEWRQKLGLSIAEFDALTPFEVQCELEAAQNIELEKWREKIALRDSLSELLDIHLARIAMLLNGAGKMEYKDATFESFLLLQKNLEQKDEQKKPQKMTKKALEFDAKITAMAIEILKRKGIPYGG